MGTTDTTFSPDDTCTEHWRNNRIIEVIRMLKIYYQKYRKNNNIYPGVINKIDLAINHAKNIPDSNKY